jgi:hypothetical protein
MARKKHRSKRFHPSVSEPFRVVPLRGPKIGAAAAPAAQAQLTYRNGPLIANVQVFVLYWGSAWGQSPGSDLVPQINQFFADILSSALIHQLAEYSVSAYQIGHGSLAGSANITSSDPGSSVDDSAIQSMLQDQIANNSALPQPGPNTLYFVFLPTGSTVTQGGSASCQAFCGYHDNISGNIFYAVMPFPDCQGCTGSMDTFSALTVTSSHELCEAITDPIPGQGWYDDNNGEIGDICAWQTKTVGAYTVQQEWSNQAGACV